MPLPLREKGKGKREKGKGKREKGKGKREGFVKIQIGIDPYLRWPIYDGPERKWPPLAIEGLAIYLLYRR